LERFFAENPTFYDTLRLVIFEADFPNKCNYATIRNTLQKKGFAEMEHGHQNVWILSIADLSAKPAPKPPANVDPPAQKTKVPANVDPPVPHSWFKHWIRNSAS
jgi:hypothetical protein